MRTQKDRQKENDNLRMGKWGERAKFPNPDAWNTKPAVRNQEERNKLVTESINLVYSKANDAYNNCYSIKSRFGTVDDVAQELMLTLIRAAELWEEDNPTNASFATYAFRCIESKLINLGLCDGIIKLAITNNLKEIDQHPCYHVEQFPWDKGSFNTFEESMPSLSKDYSSDQDYIYVDETIEYVQKAIKKIPVRYRKLVIMRYGLDGEKPMTYERIGRKLHITRQRAKQLVIKCEEIIKKWLNKWGVKYEDFFD